MRTKGIIPMPTRATKSPPGPSLPLLIPTLALSASPCLPAVKKDMPAKKAPGKAGSQGGKGLHPFPGAIGLFRWAFCARSLGNASARAVGKNLLSVQFWVTRGLGV